MIAGVIPFEGSDLRSPRAPHRIWAVAVRLLCMTAALLALSAGAIGCKRSHASTTQEAPGPSVTVRDESDGLLLTWIDDKGDFHVETRVADVPMTGRDAVRVVDPSKDTEGDTTFVVDLRNARADGTYPVRTMTRAAFEAIAVARREAKGPTLASAAPSAGPAPGPSEAPPVAKHSPGGTVVIYGASWCGACHDAARYLRRKGIPYVEKDVEADATAAREMQEKLARSGLRGGSIPVIDIRGKVLVGFNPTEIDAALGVAL